MRVALSSPEARALIAALDAELTATYPEEGRWRAARCGGSTPAGARDRHAAAGGAAPPRAQPWGEYVDSPLSVCLEKRLV